MVSFSYDTASADISNLSLLLSWHRVGLFFNHGGWTHSFNSVKSLCLENLKSMPVLFFWTALQGKAKPPAVWPGGATSALQSIGVTLPWGQCSAPLPWNIFGVCGFLVPRVHCKEGFVFPAARVAFLQHDAACVHCMARGAYRREASWDGLKRNRQRPYTSCLSEGELWNKLVWK